MQKARLTVTKAKKSYRENFQIMCLGEHLSLCFWSGLRENRLLVDSDGNVHVEATAKKRKRRFPRRRKKRQQKDATS
jgi:hypothetical protein